MSRLRPIDARTPRWYLAVCGAAALVLGSAVIVVRHLPRGGSVLEKLEAEPTPFPAVVGPARIPPGWRLSDAMNVPSATPADGYDAHRYGFAPTAGSPNQHVSLCLSRSVQVACALGPPEIAVSDAIGLVQYATDVRAVGTVLVTIQGLGSADLGAWRELPLTAQRDELAGALAAGS